MLTHRWHTLAESNYPWEQDALLYLRDRPALDFLLDEAGFDVEWSAEAAGGRGGYL